MPIVLKSGSLNLLEPPGLVQACNGITFTFFYRGADKPLARPRRKQSRKHVRDAHGFNKIEMQAVTMFLFLQVKAPREIHAILTETLACFLPGRAKDLSAPLYLSKERL